MSQPPPAYPRILRRVRAALADSVIFVGLFYAWIWSIGLVESAPIGWKLLPLLAGLFVLEPGLVSWTGGTVGHHLMGLRIRDAAQDRNIGLLRASARALVRIVFGWLSYLLILLTHRHQALHDYVCRTIVVLRRPDDMPASEKLVERELVPAGYTLPGALRRLGVIVLWTAVSMVALTLLTGLLMSEPCLYYDDCTASDDLLAFVLGVLWLGSVAAIIVLGWRGQLYGCRRTPTPAAAPQSAPH